MSEKKMKKIGEAEHVAACTLSVEVWTTGEQGGDSGYGGRTRITLEVGGNVDVEVGGEVFDNVTSVTLVAKGDDELSSVPVTLYRALHQAIVKLLGWEPMRGRLVGAETVVICDVCREATRQIDDESWPEPFGVMRRIPLPICPVCFVRIQRLGLGREMEDIAKRRSESFELGDWPEWVSAGQDLGVARKKILAR